MIFERYRPYIPEWDRFCAVADTPEPTTIRVQTQRIDPDDLIRRLEQQGFRLEPLAFPPAFYRVVASPFPISKTVEHWLGLFYIQQASTGLVAPMLAPSPGSCVLDLCAAPGGKTTHLYDVMRGQGTILACDVSHRRLRALLSNVFRMGLWNVIVFRLDARNLPADVWFDAVLVDVPCTAEGNLRSSTRARTPVSPRFLRYITRTQEVILRRAIDVTRPGGMLAYVTCTFAPEENEGVLTQVLHDMPVRVEPITLPVDHDTGWLRFEDRTFDPQCAHAWRIYPYHLDSGGLFMARLRKVAPSGSTRRLRYLCQQGMLPLGYPEHEIPSEEAAGQIMAVRRYLIETFGIPERVLDRFRWMYWGKTVWAHQCTSWPVGFWRPARNRQLVGVGVRVARRTRFGWKPSSYFLQHLSPWVRERRVSLAPNDWIRLLQGQTIPVTRMADGYVALALEDAVLGCGHVRQGRVRHMIPAERTRLLQDVMQLRIQHAISGA